MFDSHNVIFLPVVDSTNDYLQREHSHLKDFTVVMADSQTKGRGRLERVWQSDNRGNIYASFFLRDNLLNTENPIHLLTCYLAVVICEVLTDVLHDLNVEVAIKWPNDVLVNGKKVAGILAETVFDLQKFQGLILGFGLNLNLKQEEIDKIDKPATSLNLLLQKKIEKKELLFAIINQFKNQYKNFHNKGFIAIRDEYLFFSEIIGKIVVINLPEGQTVKGLVINVENDGSLLLRDDKGEILKINVGELKWI